MMEARLSFPGGFCFETRTGMKSGWPDTSHGDTFGHELVFSYIESQLGFRMKHALYGDDNFFLKPDHVTEDMITMLYKRCGFKVKVITTSKYLSEVDYLSKNIVYSHGEYYIFRDTVETFSRLLMPEEGNPTDREYPDEIVAAERLIGHLIDNPFNEDVRFAIYKMLEHLRDHYQIYSVNFSDHLRRQYMWKPNDISRIENIPIIPDFEYIKELYGVSDVPLLLRWPDVDLKCDSLDFSIRERSMDHFMNACSFYRNVRNNVYWLGTRNRINVVSMTSPYLSPKIVSGYHAARLGYVIKALDIKFDTVLDFGTHPGACAQLLLKRAKRVVGVSLIPEVDGVKRHKRICPYVLRCKEFEFIEQDANTYVVKDNFDLLHDDVDAVFVSRHKDFDIDQALASLARIRNACKRVKHAIMTVHDVNHAVLEAIYHTYRDFGEVHIIKPHYSNPWKPEFVVHFEHSRKELMRRTDFNKSCYALFNGVSHKMVTWCNIINYNVERVKAGDSPFVCPYHEDDIFQNRIRSRLFVGEAE
jgi:hypothetical protein